MPITAAQLRELHEANPETAFDAMSKLFNDKLAESTAEIEKRNKTIGELRAGRVSRAILDQLTTTGEVPAEHEDDESVKKLLAVRRELDEAKKTLEARGDYDEVKTKLDESAQAMADLQANFDEAQKHLDGYRAKEDQSWRQDSILAVAKEHKIPLRPGLVRFAEQTLRPYWQRDKTGALSLSRDGKPLVDEAGKEISAKALLEDLRHGKILGSENTVPDLFDQITNGPPVEGGGDNGDNPVPGRPEVDAALQSGSLAQIHAAAYGAPPQGK